MTEKQMRAYSFEGLYAQLRAQMLRAEIIKSGRWQSTDVGHIDALDTPELWDVTLRSQMPETEEGAQRYYLPNLPWAEEHFQERVGGKPTNPGDTYMRWPWYKGGVENHKQSGEFSHTYQERIWPKWAMGGRNWAGQNWHKGIRYDYGDLNDVVELLTREPLTRQAYLPIWFPEDTGVVHGERVPCSIGYQFLIRNNHMNMIYTIRSCDFVRYLRDDLYLACRLAQWVRDKVVDNWVYSEGEFEVRRIDMGSLTMHIGSLHCFRGDLQKLTREHEEYMRNVASTN